MGAPLTIEEAKFDSWLKGQEANRPQQLNAGLNKMFDEMNKAAKESAKAQGLTEAQIKANLENAISPELTTRTGFVSQIKTLLSIPAVDISLQDIFDRIQNCYL